MKPRIRGPAAAVPGWFVGAVVLLATVGSPGTAVDRPALPLHAGSSPTGPVANFTSALDRLVALVAAGGGALLALVWARVAISWFSNDVTKKVQAKDRARDALIGTLVFTAAISGLVWALAQWVVTGA
jgi:hypothetical protein